MTFLECRDKDLIYSGLVCCDPFNIAVAELQEGNLGWLGQEQTTALCCMKACFLYDVS